MSEEKTEIEAIYAWLQARPNNAAIFATDTGFMAQTLEAGDTVREAEGSTIGETIVNWLNTYGKAETK